MLKMANQKAIRKDNYLTIIQRIFHHQLNIV